MSIDTAGRRLERLLYRGGGARRLSRQEATRQSLRAIENGRDALGEGAGQRVEWEFVVGGNTGGGSGALSLDLSLIHI